MKKFLLTGALVVFMAVAAQAQVTFEYSRTTRNSSLTVTYSSGYGYYGYGGYGSYGYGGGGPYFGGAPGYGYRPGYGYVYTPGPSPDSMGGYWGGYGYGPYGGYGGYYGRGYGPYGYGGFGRPYAATESAGPAAPAGPVSDRLPEFASAREIEEGRRRFKSGDYKGAADQFRAALTAKTDNSLAQAWFAVALVITGDGKNADKALRGAAGSFGPEKIALADLFRDDKERARVAATLIRTGPEGALAAAFALSRMGDADRLKALGKNDPVALKLQAP